MKITWALSVAIVEAPLKETETSAFLRAIESFMPSPTKQTFLPIFCSLSIRFALSSGRTWAK
ncbi:hypothetical protein MCHI_002621 [Candidatus Magnetoovum chiemensis]|nr:hypothetical protein MCHI_002621 [Candidatus Magnetoovum chiemensis]